jgi:hypothetical protein
MSEQPTIYDIGLGEKRPVTQKDADAFMAFSEAHGRFVSAFDDELLRFQRRVWSIRENLTQDIQKAMKP